MDTAINAIERNSGADVCSAAQMRRETPRLRNWLRRNLADRAEVDDMLQDVFIELVLANRAARRIEDVGAWLFRVTKNRVIDALRRKDPTRAVIESSDDTGELQGLLPDPAAGPEAALAREVLVQNLLAALDELPADQREVYFAHALQGESFASISARSGVGLNTLLARKMYAVRKLRGALEKSYRDYLID